LSQFEVFLDWKPSTTVAFSENSIVREITDKDSDRFSLSLRDSKLDVEWIFKVVKRIVYCIRFDGVFIFSIEFDTTEDPSFSNSDKTAICCAVSSFIKEDNGHFHYFDRKTRSYDSVSEMSPLFKYPVQIETPVGASQDPKQYCLDAIASSDELLKVMAKKSSPRRKDRVSSVLTPPLPTPAILVLRRRYAARLDRTFAWIADLRRRRHMGLHVFHRAFYIFALYLIAVFGYTVYREDKASTFDVADRIGLVLAGLLSALAYILIFTHILKPLSKFLDSESRRRLLPNFFSQSTRAGISRRFESFGSRFSAFDLKVFLLLAGPFVFPLREIPDPIEFIKLLKVFDGTSWLDAILQLFSVASIESAISGNATFIKSFVHGLFFFAFLPITLLQVSERLYRSKAIQALDALVGHLRYGTVLDAVLGNVWVGLERRPVQNFGYYMAIEIAERRLNAEVFKRSRNGVIFTFAWVSYLIYMYLAYLR
jgi:hypothetical protein